MKISALLSSVLLGSSFAAAHPLYPRIINGDNATAPVPFFAVTRQERTFGFGDTKFTTNTTLCGGSLIANNLILTAGHCAHLFASGENNIKQIVSGRLDYNKSTEEEGGIDWEFIHYFWHPEYRNIYAKDRTSTPVNDIALVKVKQKGNSTKPVPIVEYNRDPSMDPAPGTEMNLVGLGTVTIPESTSPTVLQALTLPLISKEECLSKYRNRETIDQTLGNVNTTLCTLYPGGTKYGCKGDSGSPLFKMDASGKPKVYGVVSWQSSPNICGGPDSPEVFARVSTLSAWIDEIVAKHGNDDLPVKPKPKQ